MAFDSSLGLNGFVAKRQCSGPLTRRLKVRVLPGPLRCLGRALKSLPFQGRNHGLESRRQYRIEFNLILYYSVEVSYKDPKKQSNYMRIWMQNRRTAWFADKCCVKCKSTERLELDHLVPKDKVSHRIWSWSADRRQEELNKCQVLCRKCHIAKHAAERTKGLRHGVITGYTGYACRCDLCRKAHREQMRSYRLRVRTSASQADNRDSISRETTKLD